MPSRRPTEPLVQRLGRLTHVVERAIEGRPEHLKGWEVKL